ncbi:FkbM family methyltransferase [Oscillospiraceae bacterium PP1C4]
MLSFMTETQTVWERLVNTEKPVVLYGMGLGAEKIMRVLDRYGVKVADIFASDEFVRGHSFCGYRVMKLSEVQQKYDDFIIVVAFAFWQDDLIERVCALSLQYELVAPHVPVIGEGIVDFTYLSEHEKEIADAYSRLADEQSRRVFSAVMNYKISGKIDGILAVTTPKQEAYGLIRPTRGDAYLDLGAYDGDTIREMMEKAGGELRRVVAVEPDPKNYRKLTTFTENLAGDVTTLNVGIYDRDTTLVFANKAGRHSAVSRDGKGVEIPMRSIDSIADGQPFTLIKMDVEGEEKQALEGGREQLARFAPRLIVSAYHRNEDTFALVNQIHALNPDYQIYLRQHPYIPAWDNNIYAIREGAQ